MKSKRAKYQIMLKSNGNDISTESAEEAVDIAEEDMVDKAVNAFCAVHCPKGCPLDNSEGCGALREFKQKMME